MGYENFGKLVMPENSESKGFVVFFPPAVGDSGQQEFEAIKLTDYGYASLLYDAPYRRGLSYKDPRIWKIARAEMDEILFFQNNVILAGKNLGGSFAAYCFRDEYRGLIVSGSIPFLSRASHGTAPDFDFSVTEKKIHRPVLIQMGRLDTWINDEQRKNFEESVSPRHLLEWYDDGHEMNHVETVNQRRLFIYTLLNRRQPYVKQSDPKLHAPNPGTRSRAEPSAPDNIRSPK